MSTPTPRPILIMSYRQPQRRREPVWGRVVGYGLIAVSALVGLALSLYVLTAIAAWLATPMVTP